MPEKRTHIGRDREGLLRSVWLFPSILIAALLLMTVLRLSGSSMGVYSMLDGDKDPNVITKNYRGVRSDEWLVNTQLLVAQARANFPLVNRNIGNGQNMSLMNLPYREWSVFFKPQNLVYFVLPLDFAFAFRWWLPELVLVVATYLLALEMFPKKVLRAVGIAAFVGLSPMIFWWYSTDIALFAAYTLLISFFAIRVMRSEGIRKLLFGAGLSYLLICFALLLYPPFQIPCVFVAGSFFTGYLLENYRRKDLAKTLRSIGYLALASVVAVAVVFVFLKTRAQAVDLITHTAYPGTRVELSGGVNPLKSFSSFLSPNFQYDSKALGYFANQSEASNFIFIAPFLLLPAFYIAYVAWKRRRKVLYSLLFTNALILLFLARMYITTPKLEFFYRLLQFDKVSGTRFLLGAGLAGVLQLLLMVKALDEKYLKPKEIIVLSWLGAGTGMIVMAVVGNYTIQHYPVFISNYLKVLAAALWVATGVYLVLRRRVELGVLLLAAFSLFSIYRINPLYRGTFQLTNSEIIKKIQGLPNDGRWVVLDDRMYINFPLMAGRSSLNSVQFLPQLSQWQQLDKTGQYKQIYNRYAHIVFSSSPQAQPFVLKYADLINVRFDPCGEFIQNSVKYVLSPKKVDQSCLKLTQVIDLPARDFFIYQITPGH